MGGVQFWWDPGSGVDIFSDLSPRAKPYFGVRFATGNPSSVIVPQYTVPVRLQCVYGVKIRS